MTKLKKVSNFKELPSEKLCWQCKPGDLAFETTDDVRLTTGIIGQRRAVKALRLGLDIESFGYNMFVTGRVGTGRKTAINHLIVYPKRAKRIPDDKLYVNNFKNPDVPILLRLPAGKGREFKQDMEEIIGDLESAIPAVFESEEYEERKKKVVEEFKAQQNALVKSFEKEAGEKGFTIVQLQVAGMVAKPGIAPVFDGKPVTFEQLNMLVKEGKFPQEKLDSLEKDYSDVTAKMEAVFKEMRALERTVREKVKKLDHQMIKPLVRHRIDEIISKYENHKVRNYLEDANDHILENLGKFREKPEQEKPLAPTAGDPFLEYSVNLIVDNHGVKKAPVIFETSPNYRNLFGAVERVVDVTGHWETDFTKIKAGSFLQADGGYLILEALDTLLEPRVWPTLKRTLRNRRVEIQSYDPFYFLATSALKPEPIDCDVKVIMIGDAFLYHLLYERDEDFKKIFKVRADFDSVMDVSKQAITRYATFIKKIVSQENLRNLRKGAVGRVIQYGMRLAGTKKKLSTEFNTIADLLREANYWAQKDESTSVDETHVNKALEEKIDRCKQIEEKIQELIKDGTIMIDTRGKAVGQVNGLSVLDTGEYSFGRPSRITAEASVGASGIIDIEREAELSGRIHSKGMLILAGYLRGKYAQEKPLAMSASICFEQSYTGVEGDSASSAEVYALLSSLSGLPLRQDIAVTGSVNQKGEIQPIGGVNQKIEGFFDVCRIKGSTSLRGVIIPAKNVDDLMLKKDVVDAVRKGEFHIYAIRTIDEGIEILTGIKAGKKRGSSYELGTVNYLVDARLKEFAEKWQSYRLGADSL